MYNYVLSILVGMVLHIGAPKHIIISVDFCQQQLYIQGAQIQPLQHYIEFIILLNVQNANILNDFQW